MSPFSRHSVRAVHSHRLILSPEALAPAALCCRGHLRLPASSASLLLERYVNREREGGTEPSGGDFYNNQNTRIGELFATQVLRAAMEGRIGFKEAYDLTGLQGGTFQKYAGRLAQVYQAERRPFGIWGDLL